MGAYSISSMHCIEYRSSRVFLLWSAAAVPSLFYTFLFLCAERRLVDMAEASAVL